MRSSKYLIFCLSVQLHLFITYAQNASSSTRPRSSAQIVTSSTPNTGGALASGIVLRVQPLGDSITYGFASSDGNGYRLALEDTLTSGGNVVSYAGSQQGGNMVDNYNEGHNGALISEIAGYAPLSLPFHPNVVLLMAGTNDCNFDVDVDAAPDRLQSLIQEVIDAVPEAAVLVALIPPLPLDTNNGRRAVPFRNAIPAVLDRLVRQGRHIVGVNMSSFITIDDLADGIHPTDEGYHKMAGAWFEGLKAADALGYVKPAPLPQAGFTNASATTAPAASVSMMNGAMRVSDALIFSMMLALSLHLGMLCLI